MNALKSRWFGLKSRGRHSLPRPWRPHSLLAFRIALTAVVVGLLTYLSPYQRPYNVAQLRVGSSAQERIKAPFLFHVPKSEVELDRERLAHYAFSEEQEKKAPTTRTTEGHRLTFGKCALDPYRCAFQRQ